MLHASCCLAESATNGALGRPRRYTRLQNVPLRELLLSSGYECSHGAAPAGFGAGSWRRLQQAAQLAPFICLVRCCFPCAQELARDACVPGLPLCHACCQAACYAPDLLHLQAVQLGEQGWNLVSHWSSAGRTAGPCPLPCLVLPLPAGLTAQVQDLTSAFSMPAAR